MPISQSVSRDRCIRTSNGRARPSLNQPRRKIFVPARTPHRPRTMRQKRKILCDPMSPQSRTSFRANREFATARGGTIRVKAKLGTSGRASSYLSPWRGTWLLALIGAAAILVPSIGLRLCGGSCHACGVSSERAESRRGKRRGRADLIFSTPLQPLGAPGCPRTVQLAQHLLGLRG
jgi:hypothetical protein